MEAVCGVPSIFKGSPLLAKGPAAVRAGGTVRCSFPSIISDPCRLTLLLPPPPSSLPAPQQTEEQVHGTHDTVMGRIKRAISGDVTAPAGPGDGASSVNTRRFHTRK